MVVATNPAASYTEEDNTMALARMITDFSQQQENYGAAVGQSLIQLGQQVGQQLAMREYQRQAQMALPILQDQMQSALSDASTGNTSAAFSRLLPLVSNPQYTQNPYILPALEAGMKLTEFTAQDAFKRFQAEQQYGGRMGGTAPATGIPAAQGPTAFFGEGNVPAEFDGGELPMDVSVGGEGADQIAEQVATQQGGFGAGTTGQFSFQMGQVEPVSEDIQTKAQKDEEEYLNATPEQLEEFNNSIRASSQPKGTKLVRTPGLEQFRGFEDVVGINVPTEQFIDFPKKLLVSEDARGKRFSTEFEKRQVNEEEMKLANKTAFTDVRSAISRINSNQSLQRYFKENTPDQLDITETVVDGRPAFTIGVRNQSDSYIPISENDYYAAQTIAGLPSGAKTLGMSLAVSERQVAQPTPAAPAAQERFPVKQGAAQPAAPTAAAPVRELTLEERIAAKTTTAAPTRTATREQIAGVKAGQVRQQRSTLESEKTRLERSLYETPRAGGGRKLKRGLTAQDPDVKAALDRIAAINKQLEGL